ncbi:tRNA pseudouridine(55) synthase TruB [Kurthia huakuii]|uniref:tRNA pseudouridine(55) synthase TruB n=1 Tax=Kurthia huakuii TaxID=1421019 RepID=UPI0004985763|nr:tRNA pseudouridine(55) synthase TruB [Kurthia huakuii]MBM7698283.1 tRNA pseudouridine55 synthase [Kurthia huakuii]
MHGILPLWKERGMTSHDCVFKVRKILRMKKVGHTGTLDPGVDGVLPICLGNATRLAEYITDAGKIYEAIISIGRSTTTEDAEGDTVEENRTAKNFSRKELEAVFEQLTGTITQTPPMYSAVKVNGRKLYEYARAGQTVERPSRQVSISRIELLENHETFSGDEVTFSVRIHCGKGTYIRTLAVQMGELLGYPAHMAKLTRVMSGSYTREQCVTLAELQVLADEERLTEVIRPLETALTEFPHQEITIQNEKQVKNGMVLPMHSKLSEHDKLVFTEQEKAVAVYVKHPSKEGQMKPEKMFPNID